MSQRKAAGIIIGCVVASSLVVGLLGCLGTLVLLLPDGPKHAHRYLRQVQVDPAYRQVGQGGQGNCNCNLEYFYIGPSHTDSAQVFSGPALTLQPTDGSIAVWDRLLEGEGASELLWRPAVWWFFLCTYRASETMPSTAARAATHQALDRIGLFGLPGRLVSRISPGEQGVRVAASRAGRSVG